MAITKAQLVEKIKSYPDYKDKKESTLMTNKKDVLISILEKLSNKTLSEIELEPISKGPKTKTNTISKKETNIEIEDDFKFEPFSFEDDEDLEDHFEEDFRLL
jgi:hypothetical protein